MTWLPLKDLASRKFGDWQKQYETCKLNIQQKQKKKKINQQIKSKK